jgi:hypothetical protein
LARHDAADFREDRTKPVTAIAEPKLAYQPTVVVARQPVTCASLRDFRTFGGTYADAETVFLVLAAEALAWKMGLALLGMFASLRVVITTFARGESTPTVRPLEEKVPGFFHRPGERYDDAVFRRRQA